VTNLRRPAKKVVAFYNGRGTAEQWIKEGKHAVKWTRLSCTTFRANAVRLQLHALAYNLANFLRTLALPKVIADWSLTSLREKVVKIGRRSWPTAATWSSRWRRWRCRASCSVAFSTGSRGCVRQTRLHAAARREQRRQPEVELRPEYLLAVLQSGRKALGNILDPRGGGHHRALPCPTGENPCRRGHEGGIQAQGRGWAPSIWEIRSRKRP